MLAEELPSLLNKSLKIRGFILIRSILGHAMGQTCQKIGVGFASGASGFLFNIPLDELTHFFNDGFQFAPIEPIICDGPNVGQISHAQLRVFQKSKEWLVGIPYAEKRIK